MLKTRKKLATMAVAAAVSGGALMSGAVQALNVSQNNVGEVLLFPYYTVKNGLDTVFTVTNTTNKTAAFKIRFREALNSREVRDFNVVLSPYDHWSGAVTAVGSGAAVRTFDKSCTSPDKPAWTASGTGYQVDFTNALFSGIYGDGGDTDISRVKEGYFEVILMGVSSRDPSVSSNVVEYNAKHVAGVPRSCAKVDEAFLNTGSSDWAGFIAPENVLKGHVTYIDVATGKSMDAEPTAIEDFKSGSTNADDILSAPGNASPDLNSGDLTGTVHVISDGVAIATPYTGGSANGVSMALMATSVINEFSAGTGAATSWVVTFPTKHHFTDAYDLTLGTITNSTVYAPFTHRFVGDADGTGKSCDTIGMSLFNREEGTVTTVSNNGFSPQPPVDTSVSLCYEANVINFNASSNVFGAGTNRLTVDTSAVGTAGWAKLSFTSTAATTAANRTGPYVGLPVIGFAAVMRDAGSASVNYGSNLEHAYVSGARAN